LDAAKIAVQLDLTKEPLLIFADGGQLQHVLLNLIANAADAMHATSDAPRVLTVTSNGVEAKSVTVLVEDTGIGIDPGHIDRIFEAFFTTKSNGMGLGLAICQSIVESYGGAVTAEAKTTPGSILRVNLPTTQAPE
jgi:signal transduction histidine kinase